MPNTTPCTTLNGGSGGGGGEVQPGPVQVEQEIHLPSPSQGNPGGQVFTLVLLWPVGGGGGGAIAVGSNAAPPYQGGNPGGAGAGLPTAFGCNGVPCGAYRYYAGGGGSEVHNLAGALGLV
jgi:hypothetical protein